MSNTHSTLESLFGDIADAIRTKDGTSAEIKADNFPSRIEAIDTSPTKASLSLAFNNTKIEQFIANVTYTSDYTSSSVESYTSDSNSGAPSGVSTTLEEGTLNLFDNGGKCSQAVSAGSNVIYNVAPNHTGAFEVVSDGKIVSGGEITSSGNLRVIKGDANSIINFRDLGGWACDGGTVHYGKLFRCHELTGSYSGFSLTTKDKDMLENLLKIRAELDMRESSSEAGGSTPLDTTKVTYLHQPIANYEQILASSTSKANFKTAVEFVMNHAIKGDATIFHCVAGADRTGTMAWLLLAILGVTQSNCDKEYEITNFSGPTRLRTTYLGALYSAVNALTGDTFRDKCLKVFDTCGVDIALVNHFRHAMIDGSPAEVTYPSFTPQTETVANLKACTRMTWSDNTPSTKAPNSSNGFLALATTSGTLWNFTDRESNSCYVIEIPSWATNVTVTTTDTSIVSYRFRSYTSAGVGVGDAEESNTSGIYTQLEGADVIQISACYSTDGSIKPAWNYDSSKITVTFTNY